MVDLSSLQDPAGKRVVLTGGTGFIGQRVLAALVDGGADVTALVRNRPGADIVTGLGARAQVLPLSKSGAVTRLLKDAEILIHLAYDVRASGQANLNVFDALMNAAQSARINRIIHMSSVVVYDDWPLADLTADSSSDRLDGSPYRRAKIKMERRLLDGDVPTAILQPTLVYGPGSSLWTDALAAGLNAGGVVLPDPEGLCNAVYVDDVAQAVLRAITVPDLGQERFLISGPSPVAWSDLLAGYAASVGGEILREPVEALQAELGPQPQFSDSPGLAARISALGRRLIGSQTFDALLNRAKTLLGRGGGHGPLRPDHHLLGVYTARSNCRIDAARQRLGYEPTFDLAAGLAATAPYLKQRFDRED